MKSTPILLSLFAITVFTSVAQAQQIQTYSQLPMGNPSFPAYPSYPSAPNTYPSYPSSPTIPTTTYPSYPGYPGIPTSSYPSYPIYPGGYVPSTPMVVTPNQVTGVNPWTGGLNTANQQINNTVLAPGRNQSAGNGTGRWVNRPVFGPGGQLSGYQQGYIWNNSLTGQEHGQLNTITPNGLGGVNNTSQSYMTNGRPARPSIGTARPQVGTTGSARPPVSTTTPNIRVPNQSIRRPGQTGSGFSSPTMRPGKTIRTAPIKRK